MAIFSRRIIQRLLNENDDFLGRRQTKRFVQELNRVCDTSKPGRKITLSWEWEVLLLNVFSRVGKLAYEKGFGGRTKGDIYFQSRQNTDYCFLADVVTISDRGLHQRNPVDVLSRELRDKVQVCGLNPSHFAVAPEDEYYDSGRGTKVRLCLPGRARFGQTIFNENFQEFLQDISQCPEDLRTYKVNQDNIRVRIEYDPKRRFASAGHVDYSVVFSLNDNIIYGQLESKRQQLRKTGFKGPMGIFLCDGDCSLLEESVIRKTSGSYTKDDIIRHFLSEDPLISFVVTFVIEEAVPKRTLLHSTPRKFKVSCRVYKGPNFDDKVEIVKVVEKASIFFPQPERDACNAVHLLQGRNPQQGFMFLGGRRTKIGEEASQIKLSAREVLELLTGKLSYDEFLRRQGLHRTENPLCIASDKGQLIEEISIEKSDFQDDDWIVFKLKGPDPAISDFRAPFSDVNK